MSEEVRRHRFKVDINLESPFASQGLWADAPGVDTPLARDHLEQLIIPGSLLRGVVRHVLVEMVAQSPAELSSKDMDRWFGQASGDAFGPEDQSSNNFEPGDARVIFGDLVCQEDEPSQGRTRIRIKIDRDTGSVEEGALQVLEEPFPMGKEVGFRGRVELWDGDDNAEKFRKALEVALSFIPSLGGMKSAGFGRVAGTPAISFTYVNSVIKSAARDLSDNPRPCFDLEFEEPFLVDAQLLGQNMFQGSYIIPGGVIKGSLARMLKLEGLLDGKMDQALSQVLFSHAFPIKEGNRRPRAIPLSLLSTRNKTYDQLNQKDKRKWQQHLITYSPDWKYEKLKNIREFFGWPGSLSYHVRTRTAIESGSHTAKESQLFSYRLINPKGYKWRFFLDQGHADDQCYKHIISALLGGLGFVGKSNARASCKQVDEPGLIDPIAASRQTKDGTGQWRIVLQTPAALFSSQKCHRDDHGRAPDLMSIYQNYWRDVFDWYGFQDVEFISFDFWATQKWSGGYLARRFPEVPGQYWPFVLTQPGSVFVMSLDEASISQEEQAAVFSKLVKRGLPFFNAGGADKPELWETCPFLPENGFGEVIINWDDPKKFAKGVKV